MVEAAGGALTGPSQTRPADPYFRRWTLVFEEMTGIALSTAREGFVHSVLQRRMAEKGARSIQSYLGRLSADPTAERVEWQVLIDRVTIGETRFFRHRPSFDFIARYAGNASRAGCDQYHPQVWSLGCSTGEEVYSIAITLHRALAGRASRPGFHVLGTDINRTSLAAARQGVYYNAAARGLGAQDMAAFFDVAADGSARPRDFLKGAVTFRHYNLMAPPPAAAQDKFDLICCQNLLIYLSRERRRAAVADLVPTLKPGAILLVGPGELAGWTPPGMERVAEPGVQAYRRVG